MEKQAEEESTDKPKVNWEHHGKVCVQTIGLGAKIRSKNSEKDQQRVP